MHVTRTIKTSTAAVVCAIALLAGSPSASAAPGSPNGSSSCLAKIFQAQAVAAPQTVSDRIAFIREYLLGDWQFGQALQSLAHIKDCSELD